MCCPNSSALCLSVHVGVGGPVSLVRRRSLQHHHRCQSGIALVLVLWVLSLLTIMALSLTMTQRSQQALVRNEIDGARFRAMADGAVSLAMANLMSQPEFAAPEEVWLPNGSAHRVLLDGFEISIRIFNQASRIDLNSVAGEQLRTLLELAGAEPDQLDALVGAIGDWRDRDQLPGLNGAEDDVYESEGYGYGAADQPFESVEELLQVRGMTFALYQALEPDLRIGGGQRTRAPRGPVFGGSSTSGSARFEPRFASARALAAMQNISLEDAQALVDERDEPTVPDAVAAPAPDRGGPEYLIRVTASRGEYSGRMLEALVEATPSGPSAFEVLWRRESLEFPVARSVPDD
ncbi:Type II secretory pathway, component PulK [Thiorhodovibrio litoralis]|nr:hypothetical protein [Thiorhodovibrio winogradskyi]WPL14640.1 Type II secretory pathway, component PulK [Thiorhodovibrio litoralis]